MSTYSKRVNSSPPRSTSVVDSWDKDLGRSTSSKERTKRPPGRSIFHTRSKQSLRSSADRRLIELVPTTTTSAPASRQNSCIRPVSTLRLLRRRERRGSASIVSSKKRSISGELSTAITSAPIARSAFVILPEPAASSTTRVPRPPHARMISGSSERSFSVRWW